MKFILTGCTGFIGGEVLSQCTRNPAITSIVALSRRNLPNDISSNPKVQVVIMNDFNSYTDDVLEHLSGADACIWCMGTTAGDRVLEVDYTLAFGNAISNILKKNKKKFRYIHLSGAATERDQSKSLWFKSSMRKIKGEAEVNMLRFAQTDELNGLWETLIVKAGFVTQNEMWSPRDAIGYILGTKMSIRVSELAAFMTEAALEGSWEENTMQNNEEMVKRGREALDKMK